MTTEELVERLRRPMFNYTQAMHGDSYFRDHDSLRRGAKTRRRNALAEIHQLALEYVASAGAPSEYLERHGL
jgi:hypothetical protein